MDADRLIADLAAANDRIADLERQLTREHSAVDAKASEIVSLQARIAEHETTIAIQAKAQAQAVVQAAVIAGKLPPKADALQAKWVDTIAANPDLAVTLNALPANPALQTIIPNGNQALVASAGDPVQAKAEDAIACYRAQHPDCSYIRARDVVRAKQPSLFGLR
jgi:anion-transporting  ArsA/GET3 family ATPase